MLFQKWFRRWRKAQCSQLFIINADGTDQTLVYQTSARIEAPNWTSDGQWLIFNDQTGLHRIPVTGGEPQRIETGNVQGITNDHLLAPDGSRIYFTANGCVYRIPVQGGQPQLIAPQPETKSRVQYYLHGISPDEQWLACVGVTQEGTTVQLAIYLLATHSSAVIRLTNTAEPIDGPEFSPDGQWLYFNGELNAKRPGHSQIFRMKLDGTQIEQLTHDDRVNWFPHSAPDGQKIAYLSYAQGTLGHPADVDVSLCCMPVLGGETVQVTTLLGGQGTINSNSWAPDSSRFAFVAYPYIDK